jgi:hypothetical protein
MSCGCKLSFGKKVMLEDTLQGKVGKRYKKTPKPKASKRRGSKRRGSKRRGSKRRGSKRRGSKRRGSKRRGSKRMRKSLRKFGSGEVAGPGYVGQTSYSNAYAPYFNFGVPFVNSSNWWYPYGGGVAQSPQMLMKSP